MNGRVPSRNRGSGILEVLVGVALMSLIFVGLFGVLQLGTRLATANKARTGALSLALERVEFLRSLDYADVGTLDGGNANSGYGNEPEGENESSGLGSSYDLFSTYYEYITLNGIDYTRRTLIAYIDDSSDGIGGSDGNFNTDDYKVARVRVTWIGHTGEREVLLTTNITPPGIEE